MSNDTQPEIRFPGFTDDWEERKLGEVVVFLNGRAFKQQELLDSGKYRVLRVGNFNTNDRWYYSNLELEEDKYANKGDLLYLWATSFGPEIWNEERVIYHYHIWKLKFLSKELDKQYLYTWLLTDKEKIKESTNGTTMVHVTKGGIEQRTFQFPPDINEQQKIGAFFKQLDDTIALHQRKLDLLKETKKGFLQKMFPKNGAKVPEIRFPGFTGDWEERKFGEIVQVSRGLTYKPSDVQIDGIRVLRSSNINEDVFILRDDDVFVKPDAVNIAPIKNGDILITSANGSSRLVGKHAIVNGLQDKTVHGGFMLRVKSKNTWFTNSLMSSRWYNYFINIYVSGGNGAIGNLRKYDLESQTIIVPDDEEQQKIGAFFKQLDDTIALHQHELDLLKETKKGFLQKMFV